MNRSGAGEVLCPATAQPPRPTFASPAGPVTAQKPESGYRITRGDTVRLTFGHPAT